MRDVVALHSMRPHQAPLSEAADGEGEGGEEEPPPPRPGKGSDSYPDISPRAWNVRHALHRCHCMVSSSSRPRYCPLFCCT